MSQLNRKSKREKISKKKLDYDYAVTAFIKLYIFFS